MFLATQHWIPQQQPMLVPFCGSVMDFNFRERIMQIVYLNKPLNNVKVGKTVIKDPVTSISPKTLREKKCVL